MSFDIEILFYFLRYAIPEFCAQSQVSSVETNPRNNQNTNVALDTVYVRRLTVAWKGQGKPHLVLSSKTRHAWQELS